MSLERQEYPHCATQGCPCTSTFNGEPGQACCCTCISGSPCVANFHTRPFACTYHRSTLLPIQAVTYDAHVPHVPIDLSHEAANDGDMYDHNGQQSPPPYTQDALEEAEPSGHAVLNTADTLSVGRIVVAPVVVYVTWVIMQVMQRTMERYLA